jgi:hypothetical protein
MTYTPSGARSDLELTTAVDIQVTRDETETGRLPNAITWGRERFQRVDLSGSLRLANFRQEPVTVEVTRLVLGKLDSAGARGKREQLDMLSMAATRLLPAWWSSYAWPGWWQNLNGIGQVTWTVSLKPGENAELPYAWHYFWR